MEVTDGTGIENTAEREWMRDCVGLSGCDGSSYMSQLCYAMVILCSSTSCAIECSKPWVFVRLSVLSSNAQLLLQNEIMITLTPLLIINRCRTPSRCDSVFVDLSL